jgi:glucosylceramidase
LLKKMTILKKPPGRRPEKQQRAHQFQVIYRAMKTLCQVASLALITTLSGCATINQTTVSGPRDTQVGARVQVWLTTTDRRKQLARETDVVLHDATGASATIDIDAGKRYQTMVGFGAAITDASAWLIQTRMNAAQRAALMRELFGPAPGLQISFMRLTIGASDFSASHYSFDDMPSGEADPGLAHFSITPIKETVLPLVRDALSLNPALRLMASPWSAPGWMKTSDSLIHGTLEPKFYGALADYLVRYIDAMRAEGVPIYALTLQNEPHFDTPNYPGMLLSAAARRQVIGGYLGPMLAKRMESTQILDWDHNWDRPQEPLQVLADPVAAPYVAGVAWHCYAGNVSAQTLVHRAHPDKDAYLTECSGGDWNRLKNDTLLAMTRHLIIGSTRSWARGVLLWNLALDENAGPHLGGCKNCRGLITIDSRTGEFTRNDDYFVIAHASRFVRQGAQRIESSEAASGLENVAFRNPDDGSIVLIAANSANNAQTMSVQCNGRLFQYTMPARSVATFVWAEM